MCVSVYTSLHVVMDMEMVTHKCVYGYGNGETNINVCFSVYIITCGYGYGNGET